MFDISVIVLIYNVEDYLQECLDSVWDNAKYLNVEIILVDDESADSSYEIARAFEQQHENARLFRIEHVGVSGVRNFAIRQAQGTYLAFVDGDDLVASGSLKRRLDVARATGAQMVVCDAARLQPNGKITRSSLHTFALTAIPDNITTLQKSPRLLADCVTWDKLIDREFYLACNVSFAEGFSIQDYPVVSELYLRAEKVAIVREMGYLWRVRGSGQKPSATQRHLERKNLTDRVAMDSLVFEVLEKYRVSDEIRLIAEYKLLAMDFNGYLTKIHMMSEEDARDFVELIADTVERLVRPSSIDKMPLKVRQRTKDLLNRDVQALIRLEGYLSESYKKALVHERDGQLLVKAPASLFDVPSLRFDEDVTWSTPYSRIERLHLSDEDGSPVLVVEGTLYTPRVPVPAVGDQEVSAYLINDATGAKVPLPCEACASPDLTASKGKVTDHVTYTPHTYCYDGAGFAIRIDLSALDTSSGLLGKNALMLKYANRHTSGYRVLRGASAQAKKEAKSVTYRGVFEYSLVWDKRGTAFLVKSVIQPKASPKEKPLWLKQAEEAMRLDRMTHDKALAKEAAAHLGSAAACQAAEALQTMEQEDAEDEIRGKLETIVVKQAPAKEPDQHPSISSHMKRLLSSGLGRSRGES